MDSGELDIYAETRNLVQSGEEMGVGVDSREMPLKMDGCSLRGSEDERTTMWIDSNFTLLTLSYLYNLHPNTMLQLSFSYLGPKCLVKCPPG